MTKEWLEQKCREVSAKWDAYRAKYGQRAYERKLYGSNPEWERMDAKMDDLGGNQDFYENIWDNQGISPVVLPEEKKDITWTKKWKMRHRPCLGCPDCKHFKGFRCTNPAPKQEICDSISERFKEKGE